MFAEVLWDVSGMLVLYVALDADPDSVAGVVECALALAAERQLPSSRSLPSVSATASSSRARSMR